MTDDWGGPAAAGFQPAQLRTKNFYWARPTAIRARLAAQGCSIAYRGDTTLALARKTGPSRDRVLHSGRQPGQAEGGGSGGRGTTLDLRSGAGARGQRA
ncbi:MAG: hypothetical protein ACRD2H_04175 [Terriglobales bacterium]